MKELCGEELIRRYKKKKELRHSRISRRIGRDDSSTLGIGEISLWVNGGPQWSCDSPVYPPPRAGRSTSEEIKSLTLICHPLGGARIESRVSDPPLLWAAHELKATESVG